MTRPAAIILAISLATTGTAEARTRVIDPFCSDVRRIAAAAGDVPPFSSLPADSDALWLDGTGHCHRVTQPAPAFHCRIHIDETPSGREGLVARVQHCLFAAQREIDDADSRHHWQRRLTRLRFSNVLVDVAEEGGPGVHLGWYYSLDVYPAD